MGIEAIRESYAKPLHSERLLLLPYDDGMFDDHLRVRKANYPSLTDAILKLDKECSEYRSWVLDDDDITWLTYTKARGQLVGEMVMKFLEDSVIELGWDVMPERRRQGYALEAARRLLDYAIGEIRPTQILVKIEADNHPSIGLARKLGARPLRTEGSILTRIMDEEALQNFVKANRDMITEDIVQLSREFDVDPETLLVEHLVYEITAV